MKISYLLECYKCLTHELYISYLMECYKCLTHELYMYVVK
jgi:hypothetical protein